VNSFSSLKLTLVQFFPAQCGIANTISKHYKKFSYHRETVYRLRMSFQAG